jgi:hypothetical protein
LCEKPTTKRQEKKKLPHHLLASLKAHVQALYRMGKRTDRDEIDSTFRIVAQGIESDAA